MARKMYVERHPNEDGEWVDEWCVYDDADWLATFRYEAEAEAYADAKRLEA